MSWLQRILARKKNRARKILSHAFQILRERLISGKLRCENFFGECRERGAAKFAASPCLATIHFPRGEFSINLHERRVTSFGRGSPALSSSTAANQHERGRSGCQRPLP